MKKTASKKNQPQQMSAQIALDLKPDTPSYYVNYLAVNHTAYEFTLSVAKLPSPFTQEQFEFVKSGKPIPVEPILQLVIPPLVVDGLINALIDQKAKYEETLAQQVKNNDAQHQHLKPSNSVH
jgi:hypothetical protein